MLLTTEYQEVIISNLIYISEIAKYARYSIWAKILSEDEAALTHKIACDFRVYCNTGSYYWNDKSCQSVIDLNSGKTDHQNIVSSKFVLGTVNITQVSKSIIEATIQHDSDGSKTGIALTGGFLVYPNYWTYDTGVSLDLPPFLNGVMKVRGGGWHIFNREALCIS